MFEVVLDENRSVLLKDATDVEINDTNAYVKFFDHYGNTIALFQLSEIKGFYQTS